MDPLTRAREIAFDLLEQSQMPEAGVEARVSLASDAAYWRRLTGSQLTIAAADATLPALALADADARAAIAQLHEDGYFTPLLVLPPSALVPLNRAIDAVVDAGWPAVFAWVYDQFWCCGRVAALAEVIARHLGPGYAQIPHVFVHVVPAATGASGWTPHFDRAGRQRARASAWLALTDATLDNGCMHLVPRRALPPTFRHTPGMIATADALRALQAVRALPAAAGSMLGWDFDILHWGGRAVHAGVSRRAISMEFIAAGEPPDADESPLIDVSGPLPPFADRLRIIGEAIRAYERFEPGLIRYRGIADRLRTR